MFAQPAGIGGKSLWPQPGGNGNGINECCETEHLQHPIVFLPSLLAHGSRKRCDGKEKIQDAEDDSMCHASPCSQALGRRARSVPCRMLRPLQTSFWKRAGVLLAGIVLSDLVNKELRSNSGWQRFAVSLACLALVFGIAGLVVIYRGKAQDSD